MKKVGLEVTVQRSICFYNKEGVTNLTILNFCLFEWYSGKRHPVMVLSFAVEAAALWMI